MGENYERVPDGTPVAYFDDDRVKMPGFYTLKGEPEISDVTTYRAVETVKVQSLDDDGKPTGEAFDFVTRDEPDEVIPTEHHTNMEPDKQVWPDTSADDGFVFNAPEDNSTVAALPKNVKAVSKTTAARGDA